MSIYKGLALNTLILIIALVVIAGGTIYSITKIEKGDRVKEASSTKQIDNDALVEDVAGFTSSALIYAR